MVHNCAILDIGMSGIEVATLAKLTDVQPTRRNANKHTQRGMGMLEQSIKRDGWIGAITTAADRETFDGDARTHVGVASGFEDAIWVDSDGTKPVIVRRIDIPSADDPRAKRLGVAANRVPQVDLSWDVDVLEELIQEDNSILSSLFFEDEVANILDTTEESEEPSLTRADVPDALFPTDNEWGIPILDIRKQAQAVNAPVTKWGVVGRKSKMGGTYHFYTDDYKFAAVWDDPSGVVNSGCVNVVEPNYSTNDQMPRAVVLYRTFQKRWLARYWQEQGIRVFVDLNVMTQHRDLNLIGVPKGWRAYATRALMRYEELVEQDYQTATEHAGTDDVLFLVVGGNESIKQLCGERGWVHISEGHSIGNRKEQSNG